MIPYWALVDANPRGLFYVFDPVTYNMLESRV